MVMVPLIVSSILFHSTSATAVQQVAGYPMVYGVDRELAGATIAIVSIVPPAERLTTAIGNDPAREHESDIYTFKIIDGLGLVPGTIIKAIDPASPLGRGFETDQHFTFRRLPAAPGESPTGDVSKYVVLLGSAQNSTQKRFAPYRLLLITKIESTVLPKGSTYSRLVKILAANAGVKSKYWERDSYRQLIFAVASAPVPTPKAPSIAEENLKLGKLIEKDALALQGGRRVGMDFLASLMGDNDSTAAAFSYLHSGASKKKGFQWLDVTDAINSWFPAGTSQAYVTPTLKKQLLAVDDSSNMEALCLRFQKTLTNADVDRDLKAAIERLSHGDINLQIPLFQSIFLEIQSSSAAHDYNQYWNEHGLSGSFAILFNYGTFYSKGHSSTSSTPEPILLRGLDFLKTFQAYRQSLGH